MAGRLETVSRCSPVLSMVWVLINLLVLPVNDDLASFAVVRSEYWKFFAIVQVMKVCYPNAAESWRASLDLIPGFPPPLGALHNIDIVENLKVFGILFTDSTSVGLFYVI
jgi:hypothetical protein